MNFSAAMFGFRHALLVLCLLLLQVPGACHNEEESTTLRVVIHGTTLDLEYETAFPSMGSFVRLKKLDKNGDETYSSEERQAFLEARLAEHLASLKVQFRGQPLTLKAGAGEAKVGDDAMGLHELSVKYQLSVTLPGPLKPGDRLLIEDPAPFGWTRKEIAVDGGATNQAEESELGETMTIDFGAAGASTQKEAEGSKKLQSEDNKLLSLVGSEMTPSLLLATLALAFGLGAIHALTPGHGKTMVAAYLVGSRGTVSQAVFLGIVVTITHTMSVFLLGIACMVAFEYVLPEKVIPWLGCVSGLMVTVVGAVLLVGRLSGREWGHGHSHDHGGGHSHGHSHSHNALSPVRKVEFDPANPPTPVFEVVRIVEPSHEPAAAHGHSHDHGHGRSHDASHREADGGPTSGPVARQVADAPSPEAAQKVSLWALVGLGVSGGLVPCPEALVVLLSAISLNKLWLGMMVLVSFSAGLAALLIVIGILVVSATRMSKRFYPSDHLIAKVSIASYIFICIMGIAIAVRSLASGGILTIHL